MSERTEKVSVTIREQVSEIVQREIKDPRIGFVTITGVDVTPDLKEARIYFTALGGAKNKEQALEGLNSAAGFIRGELGKRIRTKYTPHLTFVYDRSLEKGIKIERLITKIEKERDED